MRPCSAGATSAMSVAHCRSAGWSLKGWAIAAALWIAVQAVGFFVGQLRKENATLKATGAVGALMMLRLFLVVVVLGALAMANKHLVLPVLAVYALAYTTELVLSLTMYFGNEPL